MNNEKSNAQPPAGKSAGSTKPGATAPLTQEPGSAARIKPDRLTRRSVARDRARAKTAPITVDREICTDFPQSIGREWLVTNGLGGFAAGTVSGANSRRYHGLLVAALQPPVGRALLVANLDIRVRCGAEIHDLSTNEYQGGYIHPAGYSRICSFAIDDGIPTWEYEFAGVRLQKRIWMAHGKNTTHVQLTLLKTDTPIELELRPLCTHRDYHAHAHGSWPIEVRSLEDGFAIVGYAGAAPYQVRCAGSVFHAAPDWYWNFHHRVEAERGLDDSEDLLCPGTLTVHLAEGESATLVCSTEPGVVPTPDVALAAERERTAGLLAAAHPAAPAAPKRPARPESPDWVDQLVLAADQFIVQRGRGSTVIAGYPWFTDWGRDTMIALPGLTLAIGRPDRAAGILRTFAAHVDQGMLPNRFPDGGESPEFNTVDATLWYFQAVAAYLHATNDKVFAADIYPVLKDIVDWHQRGTRYQIRVDPADGLLHAGEHGVQLTWMDAKVGDWVVTPRIGKPVEINALWINALAVMVRLAKLVGQAADARHYRTLLQAAAASFERRFWFEAGGYLYDVIDGPEGDIGPDGRRHDGSLRPNQLIALSLPERLLDDTRARAVVDRCEKELLTPVGLRSLAPSDSRYVGRYEGGPRERDGAYHQGTVWSWLLGPFAVAHFRVYRDATRALESLGPVAEQLRAGCIGNISEIYDGDAPHRPRGCFAQAWGVAELLRAWRELQMENSNVGE